MKSEIDLRNFEFCDSGFRYEHQSTEPRGAIFGKKKSESHQSCPRCGRGEGVVTGGNAQHSDRLGAVGQVTEQGRRDQLADRVGRDQQAERPLVGARIHLRKAN